MTSFFCRKLICLLMCLGLFTVGGSARAGAQKVPQANRVAAQPDLRVKTQMSGHLPAWALSANEVGEAPATDTMHLTLILSLAPDVQAAWEQLLLDQQNPASARYHQWLTPQQVGAQFGPTQSDVEAVTDWILSQGLRVERVTPSLRFVEVSGPVSKVASALGTSFHLYAVPQVGGTMQMRRSVVSEPMLPAALSAVVSGIQGLSDVQDEPMSRTEVVTVPARANGTPDPQFTTTSGNHYLAPADFASVYDFPAGYDGTGQRIAVIGRSQVAAADINNFQAMIGAAAKLPNVVIPTGGVDPGISGTGDQGEATLDTERALGQTPGATVDLIVSTQAGGGIQAGMQYNVQTLLDPVMSISFGSCEANVTAANVSLYTTLFSQAASEGISVFISSGDSGAAGCDTHGSAPPATQMLSINYLCATAYATCVGGTEFNEGSGTYWAATNTTGKFSVTGYIPEGAWNEPSATSSTGTTTYQVSESGGGASLFVAKPAYQTGTGVPADGARDVPDVAFSAAQHDGYFGCYANTTGGGSCVVTNGSYSFTSFSGTSAAAPSMAAVTAILNQKAGGRQGNLNTTIYALAANPGNGVFHDTTIATSGVTNCTASTPSLCNNSTPSATALTGGQAGYVLTTGYDQATGWGSLDVSKFLAAALNVSGVGFSVAPASPALTLAAGASSGNTDVLTVTPRGGFTGAVSLSCAVAYNGAATATLPPTCSVAPASVTVSGSAAVTATLTIATTVPHAGAVVTTSRNESGESGGQVAVFCGLLMLGVPLAFARRKGVRVWALLLVLGGVAGLSGCGSGSFTGTMTTPPPALVGTSTGSYTVTVTASGTGASASTTIGLTVQ